MNISTAMCQKLNEQVTHEFNASQSYLQIACMLELMGLKVMAARFRRQSDEERGHALKLIDYLLEVGGTVALDALPRPRADYASVLAAVEAAVASEQAVTRQIHELVALAEREQDYATRSFLQWFVDEQVEEVSSMTHLAQLARMAGANLLQLEQYLQNLGRDDEELERVESE